MSIFEQLATFARARSYVPAENFQQQFGVREVCRAQQLKTLTEQWLRGAKNVQGASKKSLQQKW